jgi:hypothetical protein
LVVCLCVYVDRRLVRSIRISEILNNMQASWLTCKFASVKGCESKSVPFESRHR